MERNNRKKLWGIFGEEELVLALVIAKSSGGAKKIYQEKTGRSRDGVYAQELNMALEEGFYAFVQGN